MFDIELYKISEEAFKSINHKDVQKRNQEMEKAVLKIIKKYAYNIDENGISKARVLSMHYKDHNDEYEVLRSIIDLGRQKYFEEEYSLYIVDTEHVEAYPEVYEAITFIWNSVEYNIRNMSKTKSR